MINNPLAHMLADLSGCHDVTFGDIKEHPLYPYYSITGQVHVNETVLPFAIPVHASFFGSFHGNVGEPVLYDFPTKNAEKPKRKRDRKRKSVVGDGGQDSQSTDQEPGDDTGR